MKLSGILVAMICLFGPYAVAAQGGLEVGDRLRVRIAGEARRVVGRVRAIERDWLELDPDRDSASGRRVGRCRDAVALTCVRARAESDYDALLRVGVGEVVDVERSVGTHRNTVAGGLAAGLIGGAIGALAFGTCNECYSEWALAGASVLGVPSLFLGAVVGSLVISDEWQRVEAPGGRGLRTGSVPSVLLRPTLSLGRDGSVDLTWSIGA